MKYFADMQHYADKIGLDDLSLMDEFILGMHGEIKSFVICKSPNSINEAVQFSRVFQDAQLLSRKDDEILRVAIPDEKEMTQIPAKILPENGQNDNNMDFVMNSLYNFEAHIEKMNEDMQQIKHVLGILETDTNMMGYDGCDNIYDGRDDFQNECDEWYVDNKDKCQNVEISPPQGLRYTKRCGK